MCFKPLCKLWNDWYGGLRLRGFGITNRVAPYRLSNIQRSAVIQARTYLFTVCHPLRELECAADALRDGLGDVIQLGSLLGCSVLCGCRFPDNRENDATHDKKDSNAGKAHAGLQHSQKGYLSDTGKSNVGFLGLVVQKGANFDRVLCGLSLPDSSLHLYLSVSIAKVFCPTKPLSWVCHDLQLLLYTWFSRVPGSIGLRWCLFSRD